MPTILPVTTLTPPASQRAWLSIPHPHLPLLATATGTSLRIYSLTSLTLLSTITGGHKRSIRSCAWKPGNSGTATVATGSFDASVGIWTQEVDDNEDWRFAIVLDGHESEVKSVAWSVGGNLLATSSRDKSVWIWEEVAEDDYETVAVLQEHEGDVKCVAWHPEEELLASGSYDDNIRLWREEVDDWGCVSVLRGHQSTVWAVDWEPLPPRDETVGLRLLSCSDDVTIRIWRKSPNQERQAQSRLSIIKTTSAEEWVEEAQLPKTHVRTIYSVAWSKDTHRIASTGGDGKIVVYEENKQPSGGWQVVAVCDCAHQEFEVNHVVWAKAKVDGAVQEVLVTTGDDGEVKIWKVS